MKMFNIVCLLYRDQYFYNQYGPAVRDLQILMTLSKLPNVTITVINKPVHVAENIIGNKNIPPAISNELFHNSVTKRYLNPLHLVTGRAWYYSLVDQLILENVERLFKPGFTNIILDFLPFGIIDPKTISGWYYWYDFIDNFAKHHRFSSLQKKLVAQKYSNVAKTADISTFVSQSCYDNLSQDKSFNNAFVMTNKVFEENIADDFQLGAIEEVYDFGFIGFVTEKFDCDAVKRLLELGYSIVIIGAVLDQKVFTRLKKLKNLRFVGAFNYKDLPRLLKTFRVGLLPYLNDKSHDGSPLKMYEYLANGKGVFTSEDYEITNPKYILNYNRIAFDHEKVSNFVSRDFSNSKICLKDSDYWSNTLPRVLNKLTEL